MGIGINCCKLLKCPQLIIILSIIIIIIIYYYRNNNNDTTTKINNNNNINILIEAQILDDKSFIVMYTNNMA